jgi:hypothetical protein
MPMIGLKFELKQEVFLRIRVKLIQIIEPDRLNFIKPKTNPKISRHTICRVEIFAVHYILGLVKVPSSVIVSNSGSK